LGLGPPWRSRLALVIGLSARKPLVPVPPSLAWVLFNLYFPSNHLVKKTGNLDLSTLPCACFCLFCHQQKFLIYMHFLHDLIELYKSWLRSTIRYGSRYKDSVVLFIMLLHVTLLMRTRTRGRPLSLATIVINLLRSAICFDSLPSL
jgi:hypothetical protein